MRPSKLAVALSTVLSLALALVAGCTAQHPRLTVFVERDVAETSGAIRTRTTTDKAGATVAIDLP